MDPKSWNFEVDQDEEDEFQKDVKPGKVSTIFMIDCSEPMFLVKTEDGLTHFELSIKIALALYRNKCVVCSNDYLGILFYNTDKMKNSHNFEHVYVFHDLKLPDAERVKEIEALVKGDVRKNFKEKFGHADCKMDEAFWMAGTMFSTTGLLEGTKIINLFTNCDNPFRTDPDPDQRRRVEQKIKDLKDQNVDIELFPVGREDFDWDNFYAGALLNSDDTGRPNGADRFEELLDRTRRKDFRRRAMATIPFVLGGDVEFSIGIYNMYASAHIPAPVKLDRKTNQEVKSARTFMDVETGEKLLQVDLKKFQTYGGMKIAMEPDEVDRMRRLCEPGCVLLGFLKKSDIRPELFYRPGLFAYPDEASVRGGSRLFRGLLERCLAKDIVAVCRLTTRRNSAPRLVALWPQAEQFDVRGAQDEPPGFNIVFLPYADDYRDLSKIENQLRPNADREQVEKAKEIAKKLCVEYNPDHMANPAIQKHYAVVEAFALDREDIEDVPDHTKPNNDWIMRKAGQLILEFKDLVYPEDYTPGAGKKRGAGGGGGAAAKKAKPAAATISLEDEAKGGRLEKLTVANLRELSALNDIKLTVTRKADIINQINGHYGV